MQFEGFYRLWHQSGGERAGGGVGLTGCAEGGRAGLVRQDKKTQHEQGKTDFSHVRSLTCGAGTRQMPLGLRGLVAYVSAEQRSNAMEYRTLGPTGLLVSRLCLGCMSFGEAQRGTHEWTLDEESSRPLIRQALELSLIHI